MNVLLTSVGRRAYMVKYFKEAVRETGTVHVCNSDDRTVAFRYADYRVISPLIYEDGYIPFLLDYCQRHRIDVVLSLFDIDLLVLAQHKDQFEAIGTRVIVSNPAFVAICNDKWSTYCFLKEQGFCTPRSYLSLTEVESAMARGELTYPVVVKPRFGCGSIALSVAETAEDLRYLAGRVTRQIAQSYLKYESEAAAHKVIFQECLRGQEYGVDIINDLNGRFCQAIVKEKLAMRAGETDIARLSDEPAIRETAQRLGSRTGHIANLDCDMFLVDGVPYVLEMNARFGGGYPFSHMAGCRLPEAIVAWCRGEEVPHDRLSAEIGVIGYKELTITRA